MTQKRRTKNATRRNQGIPLWDKESKGYKEALRTPENARRKRKREEVQRIKWARSHKREELGTEVKKKCRKCKDKTQMSERKDCGMPNGTSAPQKRKMVDLDLQAGIRS